MVLRKAYNRQIRLDIIRQLAILNVMHWAKPMTKLSRRKFITVSLVGGVAVTLPKYVFAENRLLTPHETEGPFYPIVGQKDKDFDLTMIEGRAGMAKGNIILIEGRVIDTKGIPVEDAQIELWQANAAGKYRHPYDSNDAPVDPNFQGWAVVPSGKNGGFRFKTIFPGSYPVERGWSRPPHIHFKVSKRGYIELITQMYFPGHELNEKDLLLKAKKPEEQKLMIATRGMEQDESYKYDIVLNKV